MFAVLRAAIRPETKLVLTNGAVQRQPRSSSARQPHTTVLLPTLASLDQARHLLEGPLCDRRRGQPAAQQHREPGDAGPGCDVTLASVEAASSTVAQVARKLGPCLQMLLAHAGVTVLNLWDTQPGLRGTQARAVTAAGRARMG